MQTQMKIKTSELIFIENFLQSNKYKRQLVNNGRFLNHIKNK